jgi:hypothetical protein
MVIEPGKKYRTESGYAVEILTTEATGEGVFVVQGIVKKWLGGPDYRTGWTINGKWRTYDNHVPCSLNLVECSIEEERL